MTLKHWRIFHVSSALFAIGVACWIYTVSPEQMATHFQGMGNPDGFSSRAGNLVFSSSMVLFMALCFLFSDWIIQKSKNDAFNLPNKDFWLADERAQGTKEFLSSQLLFMGIFTHLFMAFVFLMILKANSTHPPRLPDFFLVGLSAYFIYSAIWCLALYKKFKAKDETLIAARQ
jgi:uncharacterized membrane protein